MVGVSSKTLLKLSIPRIKLLRNRRELQLRQMRRDIAKLLEAGQEATARIRVRIGLLVVLKSGGGFGDRVICFWLLTSCCCG
jgi:hypothetical protein